MPIINAYLEIRRAYKTVQIEVSVSNIDKNV